MSCPMYPIHYTAALVNKVMQCMCVAGGGRKDITNALCVIYYVTNCSWDSFMQYSDESCSI